MENADATRRWSLAELTRDLWVKWVWLDVTEAGDVTRWYVRGRERGPGDIEIAVNQWEAYERHVLKKTSSGDNG